MLCPVGCVEALAPLCWVQNSSGILPLSCIPVSLGDQECDLDVFWSGFPMIVVWNLLQQVCRGPWCAGARSLSSHLSQRPNHAPSFFICKCSQVNRNVLFAWLDNESYDIYLIYPIYFNKKCSHNIKWAVNIFYAWYLPVKSPLCRHSKTIRFVVGTAILDVMSSNRAVRLYRFSLWFSSCCYLEGYVGQWREGQRSWPSTKTKSNYSIYSHKRKDDVQGGVGLC